jgi:rhomboid family GlyGly-CTERM serine protease
VEVIGPSTEAAAERAWLWLTAVLIGGSLLAFVAPAPWLDWQPGLALSQPWRAVTAAWVHWSEQHLGANLLAAAVVGAYGHAAQVPRAQAWAWAAAWPLTHFALWLKPDLLHYGGLSGVLHAGVAIVCLHLLVQARGRRRWVGAGVALGLVVKLVSERPWGAALQHSAEWDIAVAPLAHATGALAGLLCAGVAMAFLRRQRCISGP